LNSEEVFEEVFEESFQPFIDPAFVEQWLGIVVK
jgi:hypothetical protein